MKNKSNKFFAFWRDYNLSIILFFLFIISWMFQFIAQYIKIANEKKESFQWSDFWPEFFTSTFENWQSEFLQLLSFVVLTSYFIHKNSAESKDGQDKIQQKIDKILNKLDKP